MSKTKFLLFLALLLSVISCEEKHFHNYKTLEGTTFYSKGGEVLPECWIEIYDRFSDKVVERVTSDSNGFFSAAIIPGVYDIMSYKDGYAASKIQNVIINDENPYFLDIIHYKTEYPNLTVEPPTIELSNFDILQEGCGNRQIKVNVKGYNLIEGNYYRFSIYLYRGSRYSKPLTRIDGDSSPPISFYVSPSPDGIIDYYVVAYDINNNRTEMKLPIKSCTESQSEIPDDITDIKVTAYTFNGLQNIYQYKNTSGEGVFTELEWSYQDNTTGFLIYRKASDETNYKEIGEYPGGGANNNVSFFDSSPELTSEKEYTYKIVPYNKSTTGNEYFSEPIKILPKYSIELSSPNNDSIISSTSDIELQWNVSVNIEDGNRYDYIYVWDVLSQSDVIATNPYYCYDGMPEEMLIDTTSYTISSTSLSPGKHYEWNIYSSYYKYIDGNNTSYSFPAGYQDYDCIRDGEPFSFMFGTENGSFYFQY